MAEVLVTRTEKTLLASTDGGVQSYRQDYGTANHQVWD